MVIELPEKKIAIELTIPEAFVLLEWISRIDSPSSIPVDESAEQVVFWNVEAQLERLLRAEPLGSDYPGLVAAARERVRKLAFPEGEP